MKYATPTCVWLSTIVSTYFATLLEIIFICNITSVCTSFSTLIYFVNVRKGRKCNFYFLLHPPYNLSIFFFTASMAIVKLCIFSMRPCMVILSECAIYPTHTLSQVVHKNVFYYWISSTKLSLPIRSPQLLWGELKLLQEKKLRPMLKYRFSILLTDKIRMSGLNLYKTPITTMRLLSIPVTVNFLPEERQYNLAAYNGYINSNVSISLLHNSSVRVLIESWNHCRYASILGSPQRRQSRIIIVSSDLVRTDPPFWSTSSLPIHLISHHHFSYVRLHS